MIDKIKTYLTIAASLVVAVFAYLFYRRGEKIKDLQHEVLKEQLESQAKVVKEEERKSVNEYRAAKSRFDRLKKAFEEIKGD